MVGKIRVGVIGAGYFGKFHAKAISSLKNAKLQAVVDAIPERAKQIAQEYKAKPYLNYKDILDKVDAVTIATPTDSHFKIASFFLENNIPVFIEKPMTKTIKEAENLVELSHKTDGYVQVGYIERFNPAFVSVKDNIDTPLFIECHRLSPFKFRSMDIDVMLDLMSHDLDIILAIQNSPVCEVDAVGVSLLHGNIDIANARIRFENGCICNITSSRISDKTMRKMRIFTKDSYISIDFATKSSKIYKKSKEFDKLLSKFSENPPDMAELSRITFYDLIEHKPQDTNMLACELHTFVDCVIHKRPSPIPASHGLAVLKLISEINRKISLHHKTIQI